MGKKLRRTPRNYDGVESPTKELAQILPGWLSRISSRFDDRPDLILLAWPQVIGDKLAAMTTAVSFIEGILTVKVGNSPLYGLLVQHEKNRLLKALQERFPNVKIRNIIFRLG